MNNVKNQFSIKDLKNISGIKAHNNRICEKRHQLLHPEGRNCNKRFHILSNLQKLLNAMHYNKEMRISKIACMPDVVLNKLI